LIDYITVFPAEVVCVVNAVTYLFFLYLQECWMHCLWDGNEEAAVVNRFTVTSLVGITWWRSKVHYVIAQS